jgi:hypothetical protein
MHDASSFHPMRGHVEDGAIVRFDDDSRATIRSSMKGWRLLDPDGADLIAPTDSAMILTCEIVRLNSERG